MFKFTYFDTSGGRELVLYDPDPDKYHLDETSARWDRLVVLDLNKPRGYMSYEIVRDEDRRY